MSGGTNLMQGARQLRGFSNAAADFEEAFMPVIRGQRTETALTQDRRRALLQNLADELSGKSATNGPVIFEIPLDEPDRVDILVVWQEFDSLRSEERSRLILDAFGDDQGRIAQALGVTYGEALEQDLLPYTVVSMARLGEADPTELRRIMLEEGGFALSGDKVDLRFPTMPMAHAAHRRLCEKLPRGYWSISISCFGTSSTSTTTTTTPP